MSANAGDSSTPDTWSGQNFPGRPPLPGLGVNNPNSLKPAVIGQPVSVCHQ